MQHKLVQRLSALSDAFVANNQFDIKRIANDSINDAVLYGDFDMAKVSVVAYCLYKLLSKEHFIFSPNWGRVSASIVDSLKKSSVALGNDKKRAFKRHLKSVIDEIEEVDKDMSHYAKALYEKAKIKQASTAYALGLSLSHAAALTGANKKELQKYVGITRIHDEEPYFEGIDARLSALRSLVRK